MSLGTVPLSVLLVWHGRMLFGTQEPDEKSCIEHAQVWMAEGFPADCVSPSCIKNLADLKPVSTEECPARAPILLYPGDWQWLIRRFMEHP